MTSLAQRWTLRLAAALLLPLAGCSQAAWIKSSDEADLVDANRGGIVVYDQLALVTERLLALHQNQKPGTMKVAFVGIENRGAEELRDVKDALYQAIDTTLVNQARYEPVNQRYVEHAMRVTGQRPEDLFLRGGRDRFLRVVSDQGVAPDYLLWGVVTTMTSSGVDENQRNYQLTLEMVDAHTGTTVAKETARVRKGYEK